LAAPTVEEQLANAQAALISLVELDAVHLDALNTGPVRATLRYASEAFITDPVLDNPPNLQIEARLKQTFAFEKTLSASSETGWSSMAEFAGGEIVLQNTDRGLDDLPALYAMAGREVRVFVAARDHIGAGSGTPGGDRFPWNAGSSQPLSLVDQAGTGLPLVDQAGTSVGVVDTLDSGPIPWEMDDGTPVLFEDRPGVASVEATAPAAGFAAGNAPNFDLAPTWTNNWVVEHGNSTATITQLSNGIRLTGGRPGQRLDQQHRDLLEDKDRRRLPDRLGHAEGRQQSADRKRYRTLHDADVGDDRERQLGAPLRPLDLVDHVCPVQPYLARQLPRRADGLPPTDAGHAGGNPVHVGRHVLGDHLGK
jgi:hypothetical protein